MSKLFLIEESIGDSLPILMMTDSFISKQISMTTYTQQQQAVILKGIAQQILQMNIPSFDQAEKLFKEFDIDFQGGLTYTQMYKAVGAALYLNDDFKSGLGVIEKLQHSCVHYALQKENDTEFKIRNKVMHI